VSFVFHFRFDGFREGVSCELTCVLIVRNYILLGGGMRRRRSEVDDDVILKREDVAGF
jgi:hypothetical protein